METIHLDAEQVPRHLRGPYTGRKFKVVVTESVTVPVDAGLWAGGSRDVYTVARLADGMQAAWPGQDRAPWARHGEEPTTVAIPAGLVVVRHTIFEGRDLGLTFYVRPDAVAGLIPDAAAPDLSQAEKVVLACVTSYIPKARRDYAARHGVGAVAYEEAVSSLQGAGLLDSRGAATTKGKNVRGLPRL